MYQKREVIPSGKYILNGALIVQVEKTRTGTAIRMSDSYNVLIITSLKNGEKWNVSYVFRKKEHVATLIKASTL